jgi:hypothetical protein
MTRGGPGALGDVAGLMLERQKYESWLASLEARRASTPDHVYNRVRADYETRLKAVTEQLLQQRVAMQSHIDATTLRLAQFESEIRRVRDERAEAELRMQVGEISVAEWNAQVRECDESITRITEAQANAKTQQAQARELLSSVDSPTRVAGLTDAIPLPPLPTPNGTSTVPRDRSTPGSPPKDVDELEFLKSIVGGQGGGMPAQFLAPGAHKGATGEPTPARPTDPASADPITPPDSKDAVIHSQDSSADLAASLLERVTKREKQSRLREETDAESLLKGVSKPKDPNAKPPLSSNISGNHPIVLDETANADNHRTLKCASCGAKNFATEWYCERCGAELSV